MRLIQANEPAAARRRVYFDLRAPDGITPALAEAGGQPQLNADGAGWTAAGIGTLTAMGFGRYYADLTQGVVATAGAVIETRYASVNTAECPGDSVQVVGFDPASNPFGGVLSASQAGTLLRAMAAPIVGNISPESDDHTRTTFLDALDGTTPRVTSVQTSTTRVVTLL